MTLSRCCRVGGAKARSEAWARSGAYGLAAWFLPRSVLKRALERQVNCQFDFNPVLLDFQTAIDDFEDSYLWLSPTIPSDAEENCNDVLDCNDGVSCEN